jgi:hypothetical protein
MILISFKLQIHLHAATDIVRYTVDDIKLKYFIVFVSKSGLLYSTYVDYDVL